MINTGSALSLSLLQRLDGLGVTYGREDSFKIGPRRLIARRILVGVDTARVPVDTLLGIGLELGMPTDGLALLTARKSEANAVFFGLEEDGGSCVCKVYLEFWDRVRREVRRTGASTPLLLHLGVKWNSVDGARAERHEVARYHCHPLLSIRDVLRRMALAYQPGPPSELSEAALDIVRLGAKRTPAAALLYLEVGEEGNPRHSFDVNLYKTGLSVADAGPALRRAGAYFEIAPAAMETQLDLLGPRALGHLSSGLDRHGHPFLSVYGEIQPL